MEWGGGEGEGGGGGCTQSGGGDGGGCTRWPPWLLCVSFLCHPLLRPEIPVNRVIWLVECWITAILL